MIYFVDDDVNQMRAYRDELEEHGYEVKALRNADIALDHLEQAVDIELIILDVMLGAKEKSSSRFDAEDTEGFLITGLILLDKLMEQQHIKTNRTLIIFSMAHQVSVINKIEKQVEKYGINYLRKYDYADPYEFCKKLSELGLISLKS